jgi:hypothetical protein
LTRIFSASWSTVRIEGVQGVLVSVDTFDEAVRTARRVAEDARCEVVVHSDGVELADQTASFPPQTFAVLPRPDERSRNEGTVTAK